MPDIDGDIDRSEFDKYLSGYGTNHATSVNSMSYYSSGGGNAAVSSSSSSSDVPTFDSPKVENGGGGGPTPPTTNYVLMKSEPIYEMIPAVGATASSSLSSALADVRSVYYDC